MTDQDEWDADDWKAFYDERAGICEFDGGLGRKMAEAMAFRETIDAYIAAVEVSRSRAVSELRNMGIGA